MICSDRALLRHMRSTTFILSVCVLLGSASAQRREPPVNVQYQGKVNPFLEVMHIKASLQRDSARIRLGDGRSVDLILRNKRLWRFRQYDTDGSPMDAGELEDGTGWIRYQFSNDLMHINFKDGVLHGPVTDSLRSNGRWVPLLSYAFEDGLLHGEMSRRSFFDHRLISSRAWFDRGVIQRAETYGRRNWYQGWLPFLPRFRDMDQVCSRVIYVDGKAQPQECLLSRKCKWCGMY